MQPLRGEHEAEATVRVGEAGDDGALLANEDVRQRAALRVEDLTAGGLLGKSGLSQHGNEQERGEDVA
ncbi:hypothetical protein D3C86_1419350 [compost metagenome]